MNGACVICKGPLDFGAGLIDLGKRACYPCREKAMEVRRARWKSSKEAFNGIYARLRSELFSLYAEVRQLKEEKVRLQPPSPPPQPPPCHLLGPW